MNEWEVGNLNSHRRDSEPCISGWRFSKMSVFRDLSTSLSSLVLWILLCLNTHINSWCVKVWYWIAAAAANLLQSCPTLCDPIDGSPRGSPSLGFSRQEHWRGLPFPSAMRESEKWKWRHSAVSDSSRPHGPQPTRLLHPWDFPGKSTGVGCRCLLRVLL